MYRGYEYGAQLTGNLEPALKQMRLRNALWNKFVEIERATTLARNKILHTPEQDQLEQLIAEIKELRKQMRAAKKKAPRRVSDDPVEDYALQIKDAMARLMRLAAIAGFVASGLTDLETRKDAVKHLWDKLKEKRKALAVEHKDALKQIEDARRQAAADAIRQSAKDGLYWENAGDLRTHYEGHRIAAMKIGDELQFHRWRETGKICVRWQQGATIEAVLGGDTLLSIDPVDPQAFSSPIRSVRRRLCRTQGRIRCYGMDKELIYVPFQLHMHRPIPAGSVIRTAGLVREAVANKFRYKLVIAVDEPANASAPAAPVKEVRVTFGIGSHIASWSGGDGQTGVVTLPEKLLGNFRTADELRSIIKQKFNSAKAVLAAWLKENQTPEWLTSETQHIARWLSWGRMLRLTDHWQEFKGDEMILAALKEWRTKHMHLWLWQRNLEDQIVRARREHYRVLASQLARQYRTLLVSNEDLAVKKRVPPVESDKWVVAARVRDIAARGVLRGVLINAFTLSGGTVVKEDQKFADQAAA